MAEEKYYKPCSTCHNSDCAWAGGQDTHKKCEDYQPLEQKPCTDKVLDYDEKK